MTHRADAVNAQYAVIQGRKDFSKVSDLKWPQDKRRIGHLSLLEMQVWYAAQDPNEILEFGPDFQEWWRWHYLARLRMKRLVYKLKFW